MPQTTIITIANDKGGTGKSTISVNFAAASAALLSLKSRRNHQPAEAAGRVLLIDADPQGSALMTITGRKLGETNDSSENVAGALDQYLQDNPAPPVSSVLRTSPLPLLAPGNLDYFPANAKGMSQLSERLPADRDPDKIYRLANTIAEIKDRYRLIIIDTAPKQMWITLNALVASTHALIPVRLSAYDIDSMVRTFSTIEDAMHYNPALEILGIIPNAVRSFTNIHGQLQEILERSYHDLLLPHITHRSVIEEAQSLGLDIFSYKPPQRRDNITSSNPATIEFLELTRAVFRKLPDLMKEISHG